MTEAQLSYQLERYGDGEQLLGYQTTLDKLRERCESVDESARPRGTVYTGTSNNGRFVFIARGDGFTGEDLYFEAESGKFKSIKAWTDCASIWCGLSRHWPYDFPCKDWVVSEVIAGDLVKVGDKGKRR